VARAFYVILREGREVAPGAETIIEAQVRVLLVHLWRYVTHTDQLPATIATASQVLQRFRQLLEIHFRERWGVRQYASALGVSADRLHGICTRSLSKTPLRLIHERTIYEAQSLLVRSNRTVDQIAHFLGFKSAGQFNKLFKQVVGVPPGEFRRSHHLQKTSDEESKALTFADWP
jgi:AraC family transcriptional activator of pobA